VGHLYCVCSVWVVCIDVDLAKSTLNDLFDALTELGAVASVSGCWTPSATSSQRSQ
jgi:hypothetical protein